jgi:hypothetical protein
MGNLDYEDGKFIIDEFIKYSVITNPNTELFLS